MASNWSFFNIKTIRYRTLHRIYGKLVQLLERMLYYHAEYLVRLLKYQSHSHYLDFKNPHQ